jgi:hypothetical protein
MKREFTQEQKDAFKEKALQAKKEVAAMEADNMAMMMDPQQFKHFLEVSRLFTEYSDCNKWLIFIQCIQRGMLPQKVASYTTWKKLNHQVKKGEKSLKIYAPVTYGRFQSNETVPATAQDVEAMEEYDNEHKNVVKGYKVVSVFELKQTEGDPLNIVEVPTITWQQAIKEAKALKLPKRYDEALQEAIKAMEEKAAAEKAINKESAIDVEAKTETKEETAPAVSSSVSSVDLHFSEDGSLILLPFTNENGSFKLVSDVIYNENKTSNAMIKTIYNKLVKSCDENMVRSFFKWSAKNEYCTPARKHDINVILGTEEKQEVPKLKKSLVDVYENNGLRTVSGYTTTVDGVELAIYKKNRNDYVINELSSGLRIGGGYSSLTVVKDLISNGFNGTIEKVKNLLDSPTKQILEAREAMNQYKQTGRTLAA